MALLLLGYGDLVIEDTAQVPQRAAAKRTFCAVARARNRLGCCPMGELGLCDELMNVIECIGKEWYLQLAQFKFQQHFVNM